MDMKRFLAGTVVGGVVYTIMGWVVYELILGDFMAANSTLTMKDPPDMVMMLISQLALAAVLALVFTRWAGITTLAGGAKAGAMLGFLLGMNVGFDFYAISTAFTLNAALIEPFIGALRGALAGGAIGLVLGKMGA